MSQSSLRPFFREGPINRSTRRVTTVTSHPKRLARPRRGQPSNQSHLSIDEVLSRLDKVTKYDDRWQACCPAHCDLTPSLSIAIGSTGTVLLHCHAGCEFADIVSAIGVRASQLFAAEGRGRIEKYPYPANPELRQFAHGAFQRGWQYLSLLASELSVERHALERLRAGWCDYHRAWTFPECGAHGDVVGVALRSQWGEKRMAKGSHRGLVLPVEYRAYRGDVYVVEGASDVGAMLSDGLQAIGRPSASNASDLAHLLLDLPAINPIVVGENDAKIDGSWPGRSGAFRVAEQLAGVIGRGVSVMFPPPSHKDYRAFRIAMMNRI